MNDNPRQIQLLGGPLGGSVHELRGTLVPSQVRLPDGGKVHWYALGDDGTATFVRSADAPAMSADDALESQGEP